MQAHVEHDEVVELIRLDPTQEEHDAIRELWKSHSLAEDNRDLPGLIATLTHDCVYRCARAATAGRATRARRASTPAARRLPGHPLRPDRHRHRAAGRL